MTAFSGIIDMQQKSRAGLPGGLWPVMLTPFTENNSIDYSGLNSLTDFYISAGANGLFANCYSSEMYLLSEDERIQLTKAVVEYSNGRVPVISTGSFYKNSKDNIEFIKTIYDQGVDAVVLISSILVEENESEDVFKNRIEKILNATGEIPLGMYECPFPYKRLLSPEMMNWLAATGRFLNHKDTSCDSASIKAKIEAVKGSALKIYDAHTPNAFISMHDGAAGLTPISANFFPELYVHFLELFESGDFERQKELGDRMTVLDIKIHQQYYPWAAKVFLNKRGLDITSDTRMQKNATATMDLTILDSLFEEAKQVFEEFEIAGFELK